MRGDQGDDREGPQAHPRHRSRARRGRGREASRVRLIEVTASAVLPLPPDRAWELISDTGRYAEWVKGTDAVTRTDGPAREGSTYDERNTILGPWKANTSWRVTEYDAPRRQVHTSGDVPFVREFQVVMELEPEGDASLLRLTLRADGAGLFGKLIRPGGERDNRRTVEQLAELANSER